MRHITKIALSNEISLPICVRNLKNHVRVNYYSLIYGISTRWMEQRRRCNVCSDWSIFSPQSRCSHDIISIETVYCTFQDFKVMLIQRKIEIPSDIHSIDFIPVIILPYFKMLPIVYDKRFLSKACFKT